MLDIRGTGANTIRIEPAAVTRINPDQSNGEFALRINRDGNDFVELQGSWFFGEATFINGVRYTERYSGAAVVLIEDAAPFLQTAAPDRSYRQDANFSFSVAANFTDAETVPSLSARQSNGSALPPG